ncbi:CRISPR-associated endonuclease Cas2 [Macellibacteroides fermentans]|jgi:CRISPR-associated protein Cas2|uniref:CRISPR-associated endonuclease Cas2 n=1 Tax=Macellibacteroides fermentans TaxID=879969 RepID=UPI001B531B88|nr:CRISPR-associated endonuclease Cas2 [Parabacteroides sp.]
MLVLVTYDVQTSSISGEKRLRKVARQCVNYGQRVQNSVFECIVDPAQFAELKHRLSEIIDKEKDSIRFYFLGSKWERKVESLGVVTSYDPNSELII